MHHALGDALRSRFAAEFLDDVATELRIPDEDTSGGGINTPEEAGALVALHFYETLLQLQERADKEGGPLRLLPPQDRGQMRRAAGEFVAVACARAGSDDAVTAARRLGFEDNFKALRRR